MIWASPLSIPPSPPPEVHIPDITGPPHLLQHNFFAMVPWCLNAPPPSFRVNPPSAPNPFPTPLMG